jgi:UDP-N-acetyl-D-mannosaminuronic acid dehydrogenase
VITVIGTPLDEHLNPRFEVYDDLIAADRTFLRKGQLLVLRSTVYPGTTERIAGAGARRHRRRRRLLPRARGRGRRARGDLDAAADRVRHERAGAGARRGALPHADSDVIEMAPLGAELTKLFNNTWRYIQFATANQFYMIANEYGLDFYEIHRR